MNKLRFIFTMVVTFFIFSHCNHADQRNYASVDKMVEVNKAKATYISCEELSRLIAEQSQGLKMVDVREPDEFEAGHIPGAINVPRGLLEFSNQLTNRRDKIVICSKHHDRSTLSAVNLHKLKFRDVSVLEGGFVAWGNLFPEMIEEGSTGPVAVTAVKPATSGGCGD